MMIRVVLCGVVGVLFTCGGDERRSIEPPNTLQSHVNEAQHLLVDEVFRRHG